MRFELPGVKTIRVAQECFDIRVAASADAVDDLRVFNKADKHHHFAHAVGDARFGERRTPRGFEENERIAVRECLHLRCKDAFY